MTGPPHTRLVLRALAFAAALVFASAPHALAQASRADFPVANGAVNVKLLSGGTLYIGGSFDHLGAQSGGGVPLDSVSGAPVGTFAKVNGLVSAVAPDGSGGWYIGGVFNLVDGTPRSNLAHILADFSLDAWNPGADGQVNALAVNSGVVYVGGAFFTAGGAARSRIAAIDRTSGSATSWNPGANDIVRALALDGSVLYVAGRFSSIGGQSRNRIAAYDTTSMTLTAWNPNSGSEVFALAAGGGSVFAGGTFTTIGSRTRNRIAQLDSVTGIATNWNPNANGQVNAIAIGTTSVYAGGVFTTIGGATRLRIAELDLSTGVATAWAPNASTTVSALSFAGNSVYAGGDFLTIGGQTRSRIAELDLGTGLATAWNPIAYGSVLALAPNGAGEVYVGGSFASIGGWTRNNVAAIDATTGSVLPWDPNVTGQVLSLAAHGGVLYLGGAFTSVGGQARGNAAAVDAQTGALRPWDPEPGDQVTAIAATDTTVYLGGLFINVGAQTRDFLAQVDASSGATTPWDPSPDGQVFEIQLANSLVYVGGSYGFVGGQPRDNLAALDPVSGNASAWQPDPNGTVRSLLVSCDKVYAAGFFTTIGGSNRNRIAALDAATGNATSWNPNANGQIFDIAIADGVLYAGGIFSVIGGQTRLRVGAIDLTTGLATAWNPSATGTVRALATGDGQVFVGGSITAMGSTPVANIAAVPADASVGCPVVTITPATLPDGAAGNAYSQTLVASGGTAPRCWALTDGSLPPGLSLSSAGVVSGTPTTTVASTFTVTTTDAHGCTGSQTISLTTFGAPVTATLSANGTGLCVNPAHPFVSLPFVYSRTDSTPARLVSVTFHLDPARLALRTPATPGTSVHLGSWFDAFPNAILQVVDNGGGTYTADATVLGSPCGPTTGGQVLTADVTEAGPDGFGGVSVTSVRVRDCDNAPVAVGSGPADSVRIQMTPLAIAPATLPGGTLGASYHQELAASGGVPPYAFALLSGTLPSGVSLSPAGVLDGTLTAAGVDTFTVGVTDVFASAGSRSYSVTVTCPALAITPGAIPDGLVGAAYDAVLTQSGATPPLSWTIGAGALPDGLVINSATGEISGTPTTAGANAFTVALTDANGCGTSRAYSVTFLTPPVAASLAADVSGLCLSTAHIRVPVPFVLSRTDTLPVRHLRVTFELDPLRLALATPAAPESSLHVGQWFTGFPAPTISASSLGGGAWTVDLDVPPGPCGPSGGGQVLTADVVSAGPDGAAAIGVTAVQLLGCASDTFAVLPGAIAALDVNHTAPGATIADLAAAAVVSGNGTGATTGITVTWTASSLPVSLYRAPWPSYPTYAGAAPDSSLAPGAPWSLVASGAVSPYVDHPGVRGFWYYVALTSDSCGNLSHASNRTGGTLDYLLGDVADGVTPGAGNNTVGLEDVTLLGANYGISGATIASRAVDYLDVGPTVDLGLASRPVPDGQLDFEDLMLFAGNFQQAATAPAGAVRATRALAASAAPESFRLDAPSLVTAGEEFDVPLQVSAGGRMQGFAVRLAWDATMVTPVDVHSGGFVEAQGGLALSPGAGRMDAALLGRRDVGFTGDGLVATFRFRALRAGDPALRLGEVRGRDGANRPLPEASLAFAGVEDAPHQTLLLSPAPNPFTASVALTFSLAQTGDAELSIYDLGGRRVRTLARGRLEAGVHRVAWDGLDETRSSVAPGVYYVRFTAADHRYTSRLVHLK